MFGRGDVRGEALLQFRAGKMRHEERLVTADKRKGLLSFFKASPTSVQMVWTSNGAREVITLGPRPVKFSVVERCTSGRVFLFEIGEGLVCERHFFWLQDKSTAKDSEYVEKIKALLAPINQASESSPEMAMKIEDFRRILAEIAGTPTEEVGLTDVLSSSRVTQSLRSNKAFYMSRLQQHLPEGEDPSADIVDQVKNPQVMSAATSLEVALSDPAVYKELCKSFGVPETNPAGGVSAFLAGIIKAAKEPK